MKVKINKAGNLEIERAGKLKPQLCPNDPEAVHCGDWCPLFGEPEIRAYAQEKNDHIALRICNCNFDLLKRDFNDERPLP